MNAKAGPVAAQPDVELADLCSEEEVAAMVRAFYAKVRADAALGPVFERHVDDWETHLARLSDFWSAVLRGTRRFSGAPMPLHAGLPGLDADLFRRWLALFRQTTEALPNRAMGERAFTMAQRIARSFWFGYQASRNPRELPTDLMLD